MFKVSTKGDYGLLFLSALAEAHRSGKHMISLKEVAESKHLSIPYLSQIVIPLKAARLIESKEGRDGGYRLTREPREITMMEVLEVLEGPVSPVRCCSNREGKCGSESYCNVKSSWQDAKTLLTNFLRTRTLEDTLGSSETAASQVTRPPACGRQEGRNL